MNITKPIMKTYYKIIKKQFKIVFDRDNKLVFDYDVYDNVKRELDDFLLLAALLGHNIDVQYKGLDCESWDICICIGGNTYAFSPYILYFTVDPCDKVYDVSFVDRTKNFMLSSNLDKNRYAKVIKIAKLQIS